MKNIILIGMSGAGKSTVGLLLAKTLGFSFIDIDLLIQEREQQLLQDIIDLKGNAYFLEAEENAMLNIKAPKSIISTGGSVIYSDVGMKYLKSLGTIIYLNVPCDVIEKRLGDITTRGIVMGKHEDFQSLYDERVKLYEKYSDIQVDCEDLGVERVIEKIYSLISANDKLE
jgi:shikimate kinase